MSPSASAVVNADGSLRAPSASDSDMDIEEEADVGAEIEVEDEEEDEDQEEEEMEEEVAEEEEAEEVVADGEEEEEEAKVDVEDSRNSPSKASDFEKDIERDSDSKRLVRCLGSSSSMSGKSKSRRELNSYTGGLKLTTPSDEQSTTPKVSCLNLKSWQLKNSKKDPTLTEDKGSQESCVNEYDSQWHTRSSQPDILNLKNIDEPRRETVGLQNTNMLNTTGEKILGFIPGGACLGQNSNGSCTSRNTQIDTKSEGERSRATSRPGSFSSSGEIKEPQHKRAALVCEFFAKGWCIRGKSCRFLHVKDNVNNTSRQQVGNITDGSRELKCDEERMTLGHGERGKACHFKGNTDASLHSREEISMGISTASQSVFRSKEDIRFMSSLKDMGRERLKQSWSADGLESRPPVTNDGDSSGIRSSFFPELRSTVTSFRATDVSPSQLAWTRSGPFSSFHMNAYASGPQRELENGNEIYVRGSLPMLIGTSCYSHRDPEGNTASKKAQVSSNDWEPSEPFRPSFVVPLSILPSSGTLYDPIFDSLDVQTPRDGSQHASFSSKGEHYRKTSHQRKESNSAGTPQAHDFSDDKNSSCNQNQYEAVVPEKNSETCGADLVVAEAEVVATSVVEQNEMMPKRGNASMPGQNWKSKPDAGHDAWRRSDVSSNKMIVKAGHGTLADDMDGEVRSHAVMVKESKVMRHFRTTLIETIKELLKPTWREGRLSKDVHNMIVKKAAEKVIGTALHFHQVPTDIESVNRYLSLSRPKIIKLVEGYVEKYHKS